MQIMKRLNPRPGAVWIALFSPLMLVPLIKTYGTANGITFALIYTADMEALVSDYGDRGYRYACMDCGVIGERIQLWAVHRELGSSGIGGYYDDLANELLELPLSHGVLYLTVVGVPDE